MTSPDLSAPVSSADAYRHASEHELPIAPFDARELRRAAIRPDRVLDLVLVERARLARTIAAGGNLLPLFGILLATSVLSTLPLGAVLGRDRVLGVAALNVGSVALCFPALHVWSAYLGSRNRLGQDAVLALLVSAVAGVFTLAFAPIVWFLRVTTSPGSGEVDTAATVLLWASVLAGVVQLGRAVGEQWVALSPSRGHRLIMVAWMGLLLFVVHRMSHCFGLG
jgi:hypothetical protein